MQILIDLGIKNAYLFCLNCIILNFLGKNQKIVNWYFNMKVANNI